MAKDRIKKTNAIRILDKNKINYKLKEYPIKNRAMSGIEVANFFKIDPSLVFKTLVTKGDKTGILVAVIPSSHDLDLKKLARESGNKKIEMLSINDLKSKTGYVHGGCSPIGMIKLYPTFIDKSCYLHKVIIVSAGEIGKQIEINPHDLEKVVSAKTVNLIAN